MASIEVKVNNIPFAKELYKTAIAKGLEMIGMQCENYAALKCPVDTGRLQGSIDHWPEGEDTMVVGTNVEYAGYVELGTSKMKKRPYLKPAAANHKKEYAAMMEYCIKNA